MKKLYLMIFAAIMFTGMAQAEGTACSADAKKAKGNAACEMKAAKCSPDKKAECAMKAGKDKAACEMGKAKCSTEKKGECASRKKWYNPVSWFK